jgi:ribosomal protein S18 acetylase RimI-like enzyme
MWKIERFSENEVERVGASLAKAFFDDPLATYMLPNPDERRRLLPWHFASLARYGALFGESYTTSGDIRGAAVWLTPGETDMTPERLAAAGMDQAPVVLGTEPWERFMRVMEYLEGLRAIDMPGDHWYLAAIGVKPRTGGQGLGSALLRRVLDVADAQGNPCYLETAAAGNRPFYEKHDFLVVRQGVEPTSGISYWTFRREPQQDSA